MNGLDNEAIRRTARIIRDGGIVAYPTEAVYGLGCDPSNETAVARLLKLKQRDPDKGLILVAADLVQLNAYIEPLLQTMYARVVGTWPGPVTWVVPARRLTSKLLRGSHDTLAVRVTAHPITAALCREAQTALVSTSANRATEAPTKNSEAVRNIFGDSIDFILEGSLGEAENPTEIRDAATGAIIRPGG